MMSRTLNNSIGQCLLLDGTILVYGQRDFFSFFLLSYSSIHIPSGCGTQMLFLIFQDLDDGLRDYITVTRLQLVVA